MEISQFRNDGINRKFQISGFQNLGATRKFQISRFSGFQDFRISDFQIFRFHNYKRSFPISFIRDLGNVPGIIKEDETDFLGDGKLLGIPKMEISQFRNDGINRKIQISGFHNFEILKEGKGII